MIEEQITSKLVSSQNLTGKMNNSYENTLSTSKPRVCSDKGTLIKPAEVKTFNESENSGNFKNIKSVDENNQEPTIFSRKLPEKKTCKLK